MQHANYDTTRFIADVAALVGMAGAWTFVVVYLTRPWRSTRPGRALMYRTVALAALLTLNSAGIWLEDYPYRQPIRTTVYLAVASTCWWLTYILFRSRSDD